MPLATITALISAFKEPLISLCADVKTEVEFFLDNGLSDYVESLETKFANTKTFLYRNENVPFYDIFFPVSLSVNKTIKKATTYDELFGESKFVSIIGTAGSGKTMLMKHFFLTSIHSLYKIPLFIELRNLNDFDGSFTDFIYEIIFNNRLSPDKRILERLLETGSFIILLDGYDEIYSNRKNKITNDLDKFIDRYSKNNYILSSRPGSGIESMPRFNNHFVQELTNNEVFEFIDLVLKGSEDKVLAKKIKDVIKKSSTSDYSNFLRSPLLLSMFILTFDTYPELPKQKSKFYWNVFDTLATKHDSFTKKGGYQHERKTGLHNEDFEKILTWFSYKSLFEGKFSFDANYLNQTISSIRQSLGYTFSTEDLIQDLTLAISIIIVDGIEYKFPHKSLQEYFCAILIKEQSVDAKKRIYSEKFLDQIELSAGRLDNFWNLCMELDKVTFLNNFIIPQLIKFREIVVDDDPITQLKKFFKYFDVADGIYYDLGSGIEPSATYKWSSELFIYDSIISYLNIGELLSLVTLEELLQDQEFYDYILGNLDNLENDNDDSNEYYFRFNDHWNVTTINALKTFQFHVTFNTIVIKINSLINGLNAEMSKEQQITDTLLGL